MKKSDISPHFTNDDIHNIRVENSERRKGMSNAELIADTRKGAQEALKRMEELKKEKQLINH